MKKIYLSLLLFTSFFAANARLVNESTARQVAYSFWSRHDAAFSVRSASDFQLVYSSLRNGNGAVLFYVFSTGSSNFIIVSGDDGCAPVFGYSDENDFNPNTIPVDVKYWLSGYETAVSYAIDHPGKGLRTYAPSWKILQTPQPVNIVAARTTKVTGVPVIKPLVRTSWNQSPYYNIFCPYDFGAQSLSLTGCVATSMSQIMRYWTYPRQGTGSRSYMSSYGQLTANFGNTAYNWAGMPLAVNATNDTAAALLSYHAGVSVDMGYSPTGSGAQVIGGSGSAEYALPSYFGYKSSIKGLTRDNYADADWLAMIKMELNVSRPFIYVGFDPAAGGHAWVADGYDVDDYLHLNWGWGGSFNGYFTVDAMNPSTDKFNDFQQALIGIDPANPSLALTLNDNVKVPDAIFYNHKFSLSTKIINTSDSNFNGDYVARVYNLSGTIIDSIQVMPGMTLNSGNSTSTLTFTSTGSVTMVPGQYYVDICYRSPGKNWLEAGETITFTNRSLVTVVQATDVPKIGGVASLNIYPNPAKDAVTVDVGNSTTSTSSIIINIIDMQGRQVNQFETDKGQPLVTIPLNGLPAGIYQLKAQTPSGIKTAKLIVASSK